MIGKQKTLHHWWNFASWGRASSPFSGNDLLQGLGKNNSIFSSSRGGNVWLIARELYGLWSLVYTRQLLLQIRPDLTVTGQERFIHSSVIKSQKPKRASPPLTCFLALQINLWNRWLQKKKNINNTLKGFKQVLPHWSKSKSLHTDSPAPVPPSIFLTVDHCQLGSKQNASRRQQEQVLAS